VAAEVYAQISGRPVDGVLYIDPYALEGLVELTGPLQVDELGRPLNAQNTARFLLRDQYVEVPEKAERIDFLDAAARLAFDRLTTGDLPAVGRVSAVLDPVVDQGRLLAYSPDPEIEAVFERLGLAGSFPEAAGGDLFAVVHANAGPNKLDAFLRRAVDYQVEFDPATGTVDAVATVTLHNDAPAGGLPDYVLGNRHGLARGTNRMWLSVYSPLHLETATWDGGALGLEVHHEYGVRSYGAFVEVPPGGTTTVTYRLRGAVESGAYRLVLPVQPLVAGDEVEVDVVTPSGTVLEPSEARRRSEPVGDESLVFRADEP
jgi:hypothetical protein